MMEKMSQSTIFTGKAFQCEGKMEEVARQANEDIMNRIVPLAETSNPAYARKYQEYIKDDFVVKTAKTVNFESLVTYEASVIGTTTGGGRPVKVRIHRVTESMGNGKQKCLIFFHGGHGCAGSYADYSPIVNRYAVECDATIISVNYRLAPNSKAPNGLLDALGALMWALDPENAEKLKIDVQHIGILGDDAGGWVTMCVSQLLSTEGKGNAVRF